MGENIMKPICANGAHAYTGTWPFRAGVTYLCRWCNGAGMDGALLNPRNVLVEPTDG